MKKRSNTPCPIVYALDIWGDPWSLVILRDVMIHGKTHYREFLGSAEGIASNVLSERLKRLVAAGLLIKTPGHSNRAQTRYSPTRKAADLLPVILSIMKWGLKYNPHTDMSIPIMDELITDEASLQQRLLRRFQAH